MEITVNIPENVYQNVTELAEKTSRRVDEIIVERLQADFSIENINNEELIGDWSDEDVLALANLNLPEAQSERMSELLYKQQAGLITKVEKSELEIYMEIYNNANLRKAHGIVEAVKRKLVSSPEDLK
jgi:hypothetical protein